MDIAIRPRLWATTALIPAALAAMLAYDFVADPGGTDSTHPAVSASAEVASRRDQADVATRLTIGLPGGRVATATLEDAPAAEEFAAMLPLRLTVRDSLGQAKSGQLPHRIDLPIETVRTTDPAAGSIYYWAPSGAIAIVYEDLGQTVPDPGMTLIGTVDEGLDLIASSGNRFVVQMDPA